MDKNNQNLNKKDRFIPGLIHVLLSQDYAVFFLSVVLGVVFGQIFHVGNIGGIAFQNIGLVMIFLGTIIVYWAQRTTGIVSKIAPENRDVNFFLKGPYKYTRNPTNFGLTLAVLGLGFVLNSLFTIIFIVITYFISKFIFIKKQDSILKERYGSVFEEYKKRVKNWL